MAAKDNTGLMITLGSIVMSRTAHVYSIHGRKGERENLDDNTPSLTVLTNPHRVSAQVFRRFRKERSSSGSGSDMQQGCWELNHPETSTNWLRHEAAAGLKLCKSQ